MGKILVKAQQQTVFNKDKSGEKSLAYVLRPVRYSTMRANDIVNYCTINSIVPKVYIHAAMIALGQCVENFLLNGHSVEFPNLGIFSLSSRGVTEADAAKAGVNQLTKLNVRFLPSSELKNLIENVEVELEGVYDIAGENEDGEKYYKRVAHKLTADEVVGDGDNTPTPPPTTETPKYTLTVKANNDAYGTVEGGGEYAENAMATLKATAKNGYEFKQWNDGNTAATRTVTVVADKTYTATFSMKQSDEEGTI